MSHHRLEPCPCAREWLAAMVEEGVRRRPADMGAAWLLNWLLAESNLNTREQDYIVKKLEQETQQDAITIKLKQVTHEELCSAARDAIPLLVRLGDFIANNEGRCEAILRLRDAIENYEKQHPL